MDNAVPADFTFNLKYQKDGTLSGGLAYIEHRTTGDVKVSTVSVTSMSIVSNTAVILGQATLNGSGSYGLQATITDNGEPSINHDLFGLKLVNPLLNPPIEFDPTAI